jgi:FkbM family methyltransferase
MNFKKFNTSIKIRLLKILNKNRGYFKIGNIKMFLDFLDPIDRQIITDQKYEEEEISYLKILYKQNSFEYFLDIGANCGYYSIKLASEIKDLKIIAFEPNKEAFIKFKNTLNIHQELAKRINLKNYGLSDVSGALGMTSLEKFGYLQTGGSTVIKKNEKEFIKTKIFLCDFKVGNEVINFKNKNLCIKIDVEGHEYNVLLGLEQTLIKNDTFIQIEITNQNYEKTNSFLNNIGYHTFYKIKGRAEWVYNYYYKNFS